MAENGSPQASVSISLQSTFYLTDIAVEREGSEGGNDQLNIAELAIFGVEQSGIATPFSLTPTSPNRWEVQASIRLPEEVDELKVVVKSDEDAEIGSAYLDLNSGGAGSAQSGSGGVTRMVSGNMGLQLAMLWKVATVERAIVRGEANPGVFGTLGIQCLRRFQSTADLTDVTCAIALFQKAVNLTPPRHPVFPDFLTNLGGAFLSRFRHTRNISDVSHAINALQQAANSTPSSNAHLHSALENLGFSFRARFELTGDHSDIAAAVAAFQKAIDVSPPDRPNLVLLGEIGWFHMNNFDHTNDLADITKAVTALQKAVDLTSPDDTNLPDLLYGLGVCLEHRFEHKSDLSDITNAVTALEKAVNLTSPDDKDLPDRLNNLGLCLLRRFEYKGDLSDIKKAAETLQKAVDLDPPGSAASLPGRLDSLGNSLRSLFKHKGDFSHITRAIEAHEKAVKLTPPTHEELPDRLINLGSSFLSRFERTDDLSDISKAIEVVHKAVQSTAPGHPKLPKRLEGFGNSYYKRFDHTGDLADIANAIASQQKAVGLTPLGDPELPERLSNLGISLLARFQLTKEHVDIENALAGHTRAIELTPPDHANQRALHQNLAAVYGCYFNCEPDNLSFIDNAISARKKAVELTPPDHPSLPFHLSALGRSWRCRFEQTHDPSELVSAILAQQRAIQLTPPGHADLPYHLFALGNSLTARFKQTKDLSDITEAIAVIQRSLDLTPIDHAERSVRLTNLAQSFHELSTLTDKRTNIDKCIAHLMSAATCSSGSSLGKLIAATNWAALSYTHHPESPQTLAAFENSIRLLSMVAGLEQTIQCRHERLRELSRVPPQAPAVACSVGRPDKALEWIEHGRCLVWNQFNQLRTPLDELCLQDADLGQRVLDVSKQLEKAGSRRLLGLSGVEASMTEKISKEEEAHSHILLAKEWDRLLTTVRTTVPGFKNFLQPPTCSDILQHLPTSGPVVVINVWRTRCDALALLAGLDEPLHIPLPNFSLKKAEAYRHDLTVYLERHGLRARGKGGESEESIKDGDDEGAEEDLEVLEVADEESDDGFELEDIDGKPRQRSLRPTPPGGSRRRYSVHEILEGLWKDVVKPVLDNLAFSKFEPSSSCTPPRIWWCPTGPFAFLPLHAAGIYGGDDPESVLDYVVSSYTPTVTSLTDRVKNTRPADGDTSGLFLVSQPNAKGLTSIPGTTKEVRSIQQMGVENGVNVLTLEGSLATVDAGLRYMKVYSSIHLACHASQNQAQPLKSCFFFHDGSLSLSTVIGSNLTHADLAFLSACETSTGEHGLSEEVVHLAAGMLSAGYRRVVATMWSIRDQDAPEVAKDFYEYLLKHRKSGTVGFDGSQAAYGLHHAIQRLRRKLDNSHRSLLSWIPYVHFGL
ncbi:hypothetical protein EST38_g5287 [Candolleomyces aberdarensis]|uniref:CHAT domain-containing protein n=1 Tax=Candolleomyces aberdarensis TaxID=2316362 RepID=A0A4Q2DKV2_9AGAR|nr:hypothetical protein EST38_g5287 [Candolleomyces aberdarensis]